MNDTRFKTIMLLALILPLLIVIGGSALLGSPQKQDSQEVKSALAQDTDSVAAYKLATSPNTMPKQEEKGFGFRELSIFVALLAGAVALIWHYLRSNLVWTVIILLPLAFSLWVVNILQVSIISIYIPSLLFAILFALLLRHVFYRPFFLRFRMVVCSILGAGLLALYYRSFFFITKQVFLPEYWSEVLMSSLILMIFVTFGLSMADLIIVRADVARLLAEQRRQALAEEEDENKDAH